MEAFFFDFNIVYKKIIEYTSINYVPIIGLIAILLTLARLYQTTDIAHEIARMYEVSIFYLQNIINNE